jgi:hypothetical protein
MHPGTHIRSALYSLAPAHGGIDKVPTDAVLSRLAKQDIFVEKKDVAAERRALVDESVSTAERLRTKVDTSTPRPSSSHGQRTLDPASSPLFMQAKSTEEPHAPKRQMTHKPSSETVPKPLALDATPQLPSPATMLPSPLPKVLALTPKPPSPSPWPPSYGPPSFGSPSYGPPSFGTSYGPPKLTSTHTPPKPTASAAPPDFGAFAEPIFGRKSTLPPPSSPTASDELATNTKKRRNVVLEEPSVLAPRTGPTKEELLAQLGGSAQDDERLRAKVKKEVNAPVRREETVGYRREVAKAVVGPANRSTGARDTHFPGAVSSSVGNNNECATAAAQTALSVSGASRKFDPGMLAFNFGPATVHKSLTDNGFTKSSFEELKGLAASGKPFVAWVNGPSLDGGGQHAYCVKPNGSGGLIAWDPDSAEGGVRKLALDRRFFDSVYLAPKS